MKVNKRELSAILGVSEQAIDKWRDQGLPIAATGAPGYANEYDLHDALAWYIQRVRQQAESNPANKRAAYLEERTQRERMRRLREAGTLVDVKQVQTAAFGVARRVRDALLLIPDRLAAQMAAETDPIRVHSILDGEIRDVLTELADPLPNVVIPESPSAAASGAAVGSPPSPEQGNDDDENR